MSTEEYITDYSEVDQAVYDSLSGLQIEDERGNMREVPVRVYNPDLDLEEAEYPLFVIYRQSEMPANDRWSVDEVRDNWTYAPNPVTGVEEPDTVSLRANPEPWNFIYVIRLYSEYHEDMNKMKWHYRKRFPRTAYLEIKNQKYDVVHMGFDLTGSGYKDFGITEEGIKQIVEQYLIRVEVNLDLDDRRAVKLSKQIIPRMKP